MEDTNPKSLEERIEHLERALLRIERVIIRRQKQRTESKAQMEPAESMLSEISEKRRDAAEFEDVQYGTAGALYGTTAESTPQKSHRSLFEKLIDSARNTEDWFNKVGIALLLFGLAFLFKYSIDQGWLTPMIRVLFGAGLGVMLVALSERLFDERRSFSLVLFGGGVTSFFITVFAAYQVFELIPFYVALAFMISITVMSFLVAVKLDEAVPALIACIGGFATPFLLYSESSSVPGLMAFVSLMITGSLLVYWFRGWRPLLGFAFIGAGIVLLITVADLFVFETNVLAANRLPVQLGIGFGWLVFATIPIAREIVVGKYPVKLRATLPGITCTEVSDRARAYMMQHMFIFIPLLGALTLILSSPIWDIERQSRGLVVLSFAALYGVASILCRRQSSIRTYAAAHGFASILFLTVSLFVLFEKNALLVSLTLEALILHAAASRFEHKSLASMGHGIAVITGLLMLGRFGAPRANGIQITDIDAITNLGVILGGFLVSRMLTSTRLRVVYGVAVHIGLLSWFLHELAPGQNGMAFVSLAWGLYATALLIVGLRKDATFLRRLAILTLALIVVKLFLVDLARLEMIWRVVVFLGFGGGFLLLSYFFRTLWQSDRPAGDSSSQAK